MKIDLLTSPLLRIIFLSTLIFVVSPKSFAQKNAIKMNFISFTNLAIEYERALLFNSSISIGYRKDYTLYDALNIFRDYTYTNNGNKLLLEIRIYFSKKMELNEGFYLGYGYRIGTNKLNYSSTISKQSYELISNSHGIKVGYSTHPFSEKYRNSYIEFGGIFSKNSILKGSDDFILSRHNFFWPRANLASFYPELFFGFGFLF